MSNQDLLASIPVITEPAKSTNKLLKTTLDLNKESTGVYFVRIKANDGFTVKRIVKY